MPVTASPGNDDRAPAWLVRWLKTLALLAAVGLEAIGIYGEITMGDRIERDLHQLNCQLAREVAASESDIDKMNAMTATANVVCSYW